MSSIVRVEVGRRDYSLVGDFKFFKSGMRPTVIVRLTDENGMQVCGQAVPVASWTYETLESVDCTLRLYLAPAVLGADPSNLAEVHARMERAIRPSFSVGQPLAKAAIDLACHDLWGKATGKPVCELLGGARSTEVRLSWTINSNSLEQAARLLEEGRALGYDSFNIKLGPPQSAAYDLDLLRLVMNFSPRGFHWGDANTGYDLDAALAQAPKLADLGLRALESPLPPNRMRAYQRLKQQGALPILMDEGIVSPVEAEEFTAGHVGRHCDEGRALWRLVARLAHRHGHAARRSQAFRLRPDRSRVVARSLDPFVCLGRARIARRAQRTAVPGRSWHQ